MKKTNKKETQIVGNTGMYYVCYQLSRMGWNVMPTARNARGVDVIAYNLDNGKYCGIQVKTLSRRNPVPLGNDLDKILGDFWVVVILPKQESSDSPVIYVLTPEEVHDLSEKRTNKNGEISYWLHPGRYYEKPEYEEKWDRIQEKLRSLGS